jgi:hypothetical protein
MENLKTQFLLENRIVQFDHQLVVNLYLCHQD